jgi:hypothetical protein
MSPTALTLLHSAFLTMTGVNLGRLVTDATNPGQDFWPESGSPFTREEDFEEIPFDNFYRVLEKGKHAGFRGKLTAFLPGDITSETAHYNELVASASKVYKLLQPRTYFQRICKDDATRKWIEAALKDCPIFLVVGLVTVTQAAVAQARHDAIQRRGAIELPVSVMTPSGAVMPAIAGDGLNIGVESTTGHQTDSFSSLVAPGERVIGVQYRKVKFRLFSSNKVEGAFLDNNPDRWKMFLGGDRQGSDDILGADLEDGMSEDGLELEGHRDVISLADEKFVFVDGEI